MSTSALAMPFPISFNKHHLIKNKFRSSTIQPMMLSSVSRMTPSHIISTLPIIREEDDETLLGAVDESAFTDNSDLPMPTEDINPSWMNIDEQQVSHSIISQKVPPNSPDRSRRGTFRRRSSSPTFFPVNAFGDDNNNASIEEDEDDLLLLQSSQESVISILEEANVSFCRFELTGSFGDDATRLFSDNECDTSVYIPMSFADDENTTDVASFNGGELIEDVRHAERREQRRLSAAKSNAAKKLSDESALLKFKSILARYETLDGVLAERLANTESVSTKFKSAIAVLKRRKGALKKQRRVAQLQMNSAASHIRRISERKQASASLQDLAIDCTL